MICSTSLNQLPGFGIRRIAIACGVFDGVHLGHQEMIKVLLGAARSTGAVPIIVTFDPHPQVLLNQIPAPKLLISRKHQLHLFRELQVGAVVVLPFTTGLAELSPDEFIKRITQVNGLEVTAFCVGTCWRFGHRASGDVDALKQLGARYDFQVHTVPEVMLGGEAISSTRIRIALLEGNLELVGEMLGRNFSIFGTVEFGKGIATSDLKYPTANISSSHEAFPPYGVYASKVYLLQDAGKPLVKNGILYLGESPTFVDTPPEKPFIEIHIFDFQENIYGQTIEVELTKFLREDQRFDSIETLKDQIAKDISEVKALQSDIR